MKVENDSFGERDAKEVSQKDWKLLFCLQGPTVILNLGASVGAFTGIIPIEYRVPAIIGTLGLQFLATAEYWYLTKVRRF